MTSPTDPRDRYSDGVPSEHEELHNEDVAHEHSDINVRAIVTFMIGLTIVGLVAAAAMWGVFVVLDKQAARNDPVVSPLAPEPTQLKRHEDSPYVGSAPDPKLVTREPAVLRDQRAKEHKLLDTGDWIDQKAGIGRIPIEEAKKLLVHEGLPTRAGQPADPRLGTHEPAMSDSSSGRTAVVRSPLPSQPPLTAPPVPPAAPGQGPASPSASTGQSPKAAKKPDGGK